MAYGESNGYVIDYVTVTLKGERWSDMFEAQYPQNDWGYR